MKRSQIVSKLRDAAPAITSVSFSEDLGYEFNAIVPDGVIYAQPGMLLNYSGGLWPPDEWGSDHPLEFTRKLNALLLDKRWSVAVWGKLSQKELEQWLFDAENFRYEP
jgi:hypothetical protein